MKADMRIEEEVFADYSTGALYSSPEQVTPQACRLQSFESSSRRDFTTRLASAPAKGRRRSPSIPTPSARSTSGDMSEMGQRTITFSEDLDSTRTTTEPNTAKVAEEKYSDTTIATAYNRISRNSDDFTMIPKLLDSKLEKYDSDGALRSTIIKAGKIWQRKRQENLLTPLHTNILDEKAMNEEKKNALDLLDAISRSGSLSLASSELHVIIGVTHWFDKSVIGTLVQDNVNPVKKVERSLLLLGSTIFGVPCNSLIQEGLRPHLLESFPSLMNENLSLLDGS